jgi:hypothetical protein
MTRLQAGLLVGVFCLGAASGALTTKLVTAHLRDRRHDHARLEGAAVERISRRLKLDAAQRKTLVQITDRTRAELEQLRSQVFPQVEAIVDRAYRDFRPTLRPDQQPKLEAIRREVERWLRRERDE